MYPTQDNNQKIVRVTIKSNDVEEAPCFTSVQFLCRNNQSIVDISSNNTFDLTNYIFSPFTFMAKIMKLVLCSA